jgi:hypothetical protein
MVQEKEILKDLVREDECWNDLVMLTHKQHFLSIQCYSLCGWSKHVRDVGAQKFLFSEDISVVQIMPVTLNSAVIFAGVATT